MYFLDNRFLGVVEKFLGSLLLCFLGVDLLFDDYKNEQSNRGNDTPVHF